MSPSLLRLFITFFKIGLFTFGGGWAMISIIEREVVTRNKWIDRTVFFDLLAVAQALPGILAVNIAVAVGDKVRGRSGSVSCAAGAILPSFMIILCIAVFLTPEAINDNEVLVKIFKGIRPAVVALIIAPVLSAARAAKLTLRTAWIPVIVALSIWSKLPVVSNPVLWIVLAAACGIIVFKRSIKRSSTAEGENR